MKTIAMAAGAAAMLLTAGAADAASKHHKKHHHRGHAATMSYASPPQPIPYAQLDSYLAASPRQRASRDWWAGSAMASTGTSANAAASTPSSTGAISNDTTTGASRSSRFLTDSE